MPGTSTSLTRLRYLLVLLLAGVAWFAVLLQLWLSVRLALDNGKTPVAGLVAYLGYFTVLTNIFVAIVATSGALSRTPRPSGFYRLPVVGCATTSILVVGIVYHLLLRHVWSPRGLQLLADVLLHYVVPAVALLHWLVYSGRQGLRAWLPLAWCIYPLAYLVYILLRGEVLRAYPYPFIDVAALGYAKLATNAAGLLVGFLILGLIVVGLGRVGSAIAVSRWARRNTVRDRYGHEAHD